MRSIAAARSVSGGDGAGQATSALRPSAAIRWAVSLRPALRGMAETGDVGAGLGQADGDRLADAAAGAGHQRDLAVQIEKVIDRSLLQAV